nr:1 pyrroline 5 carboxylate dehydrogenase [Hymenolepis microstoma]
MVIRSMILKYSSLSRLNLIFASRGYIATNEPLKDYAAGSPEREILEASLSNMQSSAPNIVPVCIGDREILTNEHYEHVYPFDKKHVFVTNHMGSEAQIAESIDSCLKTRAYWSRTSFEKRADIFLKAADLICGKYRYDLLASTMLGQGKTIYQAEIDAAAELADFLRFNINFAYNAMAYKPLDGNDCTNTLRYRPTEGFWAALPPFNFTAIAGNLASAPVIMGNVCVWKPSDSSSYSNYLIYKIFREAGLPAGVINFVPTPGPRFGKVICSNPHLAGINFTGSTNTYRTVLKNIADNLDRFKTYPRAIGECGGKNYHFVHSSASPERVALATLRSAFEYTGQKCSACSRLYVPRSLWPQIRDQLVQLLKDVKIGSPLKKETFTSAVIDKAAFTKIAEYIDYANKCEDMELIAGGTYDDSVGYYIQPTVYLTKDPSNKIMKDDIFGPILCVYVYEDNEVGKTLDLIDGTSDYALTGSLFAEDEAFIEYFMDRMIDTVGNMYINVQSTGAVVGNQPFGGARLSGTNDKAGGPHYVLRFTSPLSIKTQTKPFGSWKQIHML